jgi:hypothetical protein
MDDVELWHQHEGVTAGDFPQGNLLVADHRHAGGDRYHRHEEFGPTQLVVTSGDGHRTVYGPDGQVAWHGSVDLPG